MTQADNYFNLSRLTYSTSTSLGTENTHFSRSEYGDINPNGWLTRTESPTGTITRTVYEALGGVTSTWVGLDDPPSTGFWSPTNTAGTDLVKVSENVYDAGSDVDEQGGEGQFDQEASAVRAGYPGDQVARTVGGA